MLVVNLLLCIAPLSAAGDPADDVPRAPDGRRGFGAEATSRDLERLFRSRADEDVEFLTRLADTASAVRILVATLEQGYRGAGYFHLVPEATDAGLDALHASMRAALDRPLLALQADGPRGEVFSRAVLDVRFRVRMRLLEGWNFEVDEMRKGLAVIQALASGYVLLTDDEARRIAKRVDLSASRLRALRNDLTALRPLGAVGVHVSREEAHELRALARGDAGLAWREAFDAAEARVHHDVEAMLAALFTTRLDAVVAPDVEWRAKALEGAARLRAEAEQLLPGTPTSGSAAPEIQELPKHRRMQLALFRAREGLGLDPLDEALAYLAAHPADFLWGSLESRPLYDRYLALRGIRVYDHRTLSGRSLTSREEEAILAVQRDPFPGGQPPR